MMTLIVKKEDEEKEKERKKDTPFSIINRVTLINFKALTKTDTLEEYKRRRKRYKDCTGGVRVSLDRAV